MAVVEAWAVHVDSRLKILRLGDHRILHDDGRKAIAEALRKDSTRSVLSLSNSKIRVDGSKASAKAYRSVRLDTTYILMTMISEIR